MGKSLSKEYKILKPLGKGGFGSVFLVEHKKTHKIYALKKIKGFHFVKQKDDAIREAEMLKTLSHPNIVSYHDMYIMPHVLQFEVGIIMEYCSGGSLRDELEKQVARNEYYEEKAILKMLAPICDALGYLHAKGIIHRDIKAENVLITGEKIPKLADVGIATTLKQDEGLQNDAIGTFIYMAPEMLQLDTVYGMPIDIYALGCLLYEMMTLKQYESPPDALPEKYSEGLRFLCEKMLEKNPEDRPRIEEVIEWISYLQREPPAPEISWKITFNITPTILAIIGLLLVTVIIGGRETIIPAFILIIFAFLFAFSRQKIVKHNFPEPPGLMRLSTREN